MTFSLVVVLHDSAGPLAALLASLDRLPQRPQLVAVDTASADDGPALARAAGAEVVALGENPGFGAANNAGVELARHGVTVLLNPDCELLDGSIARLAARAADGRLWVPRLLDPDGSVQRSAHPLPGTVGALLPALVHPPLLPEPLRDRVEPYRAERPRSVGWAIAACLAARTDVLRRLGPFDPRQFLFFEDMDLCLRARAAGIPTVLDPTVRVRHLGGHATGPAYAGEPHDVLARRRRAVVAANRGRTAAALDDVAQALTFATRAAVRRALGQASDRERAQLAALLRTRAE
jgi:N-acetylglucosaminyl-diphospho-decaprenol L-rhamnosyltransferase